MKHIDLTPRNIWFILLITCSGLACVQPNEGNPQPDPIKSDERVVFFPTDGWRTKDGTGWNLRIHGWIFEPENEDLLRGLVTDLAGSYFDDEVLSDPRRARFERRFRYFIVDNEGRKELSVRMAGRSFFMPESDGDGRFQTTITLPDRVVQTHRRQDTLPFEARPVSGEREPPAGTVHLMKPDGITVISDIDDTIKISHSYDRTRLLRHTFLKPFAPVPGMADRYRRWAEREQVDVVYLSNSPWQLYVPLQRFMARAGFPAGPVDLLRVQLDDERLFNLFDSPTEKKLSRIQTYLRRYPNRTFVLIGDSGEADPEIYGTVARQHPDQVRAIFIRRVRGGHDVNRDRFQEAFHQVPEKTWTVFDDPAEMTIQRLRVK